MVGNRRLWQARAKGGDMCFSATASFTAGAALLGIGALTLRRADRFAELPYASIPALFGLQQLVEGSLWLTFTDEAAHLNSILTHVYSLFSHILWPIFVPIAVLMLEAVPWRRNVLKALAAFGGWTVVVAALVYYLGDLVSKRTLQREASALSQQVASLSHELSLRKSAYDKHLDLLLDYYASFYRHYRACQAAAEKDAVELPDGTRIRMKEKFFEELDDFLLRSAAAEGRIRLILPVRALELHSETLRVFNEFKRVMERKLYDDEFHTKKAATFMELHLLKDQLEKVLREFLRTEHLLAETNAK